MRYTICLLIFFLLLSCTRDKENSDGIKSYSFSENTLTVDENGLECHYVPLETTDENLFSDVDFFHIYKDTIFLITKEQNRVLLFDLSSGEWIGEIGGKGKGPGEHIYPSNLHIDESANELILADKGQYFLSYYRLPDFKYMERKSITPFSDCTWLADGKIAWAFSAFKDDKRNFYNLKITDDLKDISYLYKTDFCPKYQMTLGRSMYDYNGDSYLNLPFEPVVYRVTSTSVTPAYRVDYGKYHFASNEWLLENASEHYYGALFSSDYVSAHRLFETDTHIATMFTCKGANMFVGLFNKADQTSCILKASEFVRQSGLTGMISFIGTYNNNFVTLLSPSSLNNTVACRGDLQPIAGQVSDDDNPILCFFKFK